MKAELELWPGTSAGLPSLVFGLAFILLKLLGDRVFAEQPLAQYGWLLWAADGLMLAGLLAGWLKWFPNWSYAFAGMAVIFSLWWQSTTGAIEGLFSGPLAWSPLLVLLALGIVISRSVRPFLKFMQGFLRDWSLASLALYGVLPIAIYAATNTIPSPRAIPFQIPAVLLMSAGAGLAGLAETARLRGRMLLLGLSWSWMVVTIGVALYWHGRVWEVSGQTVTWLQQVLGMSLVWVILAMIVFFPAGLALLGGLIGRTR